MRPVVFGSAHDFEHVQLSGQLIFMMLSPLQLRLSATTHASYIIADEHAHVWSLCFWRNGEDRSSEMKLPVASYIIYDACMRHICTHPLTRPPVHLAEHLLQIWYS